MILIQRFIDIVLSIIGIIICLPIVSIIGLLIKVDSKGPVFYKTNRVGKDFRIFKMYKFRTMIDAPLDFGASVCPQYDPRVTFFGRFLRRTKLNELPQFLNILKGDMTFVGPRPEAPDLADQYPEKAAERIFSVKPGLVGPATIIMRNEEECYPLGVDAKKFYLEKVLPDKLKLDLGYIDNPTLFKDLKLILWGIKETLSGAIQKKHLMDNRSQIYLFIIDFCLIIVSYFFAYLISNFDSVSRFHFLRVSETIAILVAIRIGCNLYFGLYSSIIRYISYHEILSVLKAVTCSSIFMICVAYLFGLNGYFFSIAAMDWLVLLFLLTGLRFGLRFYWEKRRSEIMDGIKRRILIYGANEAGYRTLRTIAHNKYSPFDAIGFIDDNTDIYGKALNGFRVLGNRYHIKDLAKLYQVNEILISEPGVDPDILLDVIKICRESNLKCKILASTSDIDDNRSGFRTNRFIRNIEFSDLLSLKKYKADHSAVKKISSGKTILINSTGNALGLELCKKLLHLGCSRLIVVDIYESYLNEAVSSLRRSCSNQNIIPVLIDTNKNELLENVFLQFKPDIVIQAGMRKYESLFDNHIEKRSREYFHYTLELAKFALTHNCELFVLISSIVTGQGESLIIDLLRNAEVKLTQLFRNTDTRLIISRLCDIAENRGGIVSLIENQIVEQGTVILPSANTNCCLTTKYSASEFILQNMVELKSQISTENIFICNAGSTISLIELTRRLAHYHGLNLWTDIEIIYNGQSDKAFSRTFQKI